MNKNNDLLKRILMYVCGLIILSCGVSFSIIADLGVSPVSSLAYAFALVTSLSVGMMTIIVNVGYIIIQVILIKRFNLRNALIQLLITLLFGVSIDATLFLLQFLPEPGNIMTKLIYLVISLLVIAFGLLLYIKAQFSLMPYDELTYAISQRFKILFGKAKITSDLLNVSLAALISLTFIHTFGSIGIGTVIAAYFIGKILGTFISIYDKLFPSKHISFEN